MSPDTASRALEDIGLSQAKSADARIAAIASRQHGVVTRAQLVQAGLTPHMVDRRVRVRRLLPMHRGVYLHGALVGALRPAWAKEMAATLACGPGAVSSHESAAALWGLLLPGVESGCVHVTIANGDRGRASGICVHRVGALPEGDRTTVEGIPATAPARTLVDIAWRVRPRVLEQAVAEAERRGLVRAEGVEAVLDRMPRARGARALRRLIGGSDSPALTRSRAEERFLALTRKGGLRLPETNVRVGGVEVDFLWRRERVVVEVDGFAHHSSRPTFENDRRRDARLAALGLTTIRVTWRQIVDEPHAVLVRLAQTLARPGAER